MIRRIHIFTLESVWLTYTELTKREKPRAKDQLAKSVVSGEK
jgi:hypothetical protein